MQDTDEFDAMLDEPDPRAAWEADSETYREGFRRGLAQQRKLLVRMATRRFGARTTALFEELLDGVNDPGQLVSFGKWVIDAPTTAEAASERAGEFVPARLEEVVRGQLRETFADGYAQGMTHALMERLIEFRFGPETAAQIVEPRLDTTDRSSLEVFAELMVDDDTGLESARYAVELVSSEHCR